MIPCTIKGYGIKEKNRKLSIVTGIIFVPVLKIKINKFQNVLKTYKIGSQNIEKLRQPFLKHFVIFFF